MAPGASLSYTCTRPNVVASFTNVATDRGTPPSGGDATAKDAAHVTVASTLKPSVVTRPVPVKPKPKPAITVTKSPKSQAVEMHAPASWTIKVTNTGQTVLTNVTATDLMAPDCNRSFDSLSIGASRVFTCSEADTTRDHTNVVRASGTSSAGQKVSDRDSAVVRTVPVALVSKPTPKPIVVTHDAAPFTG